MPYTWTIPLAALPKLVTTVFPYAQLQKYAWSSPLGLHLILSYRHYQVFHTARPFNTGVPHYAYGLSLVEDVRHYTLCEALIRLCIEMCLLSRYSRHSKTIHSQHSIGLP